jgi:hypothetical protein
MSSTEPTSSPAPANPPGIDWGAIGRGALVGLCVLVGASVVEAILDRSTDGFQDSGWIYPLFVAILVGYALGGFIAGRGAPASPLTNGILAGIGAFVLWIPVRVLIWLARDEDKGLFTGHSAAIRPGQLLGHIVIAAALGLLGGWLGGRAAARAHTGAGQA